MLLLLVSGRLKYSDLIPLGMTLSNTYGERAELFSWSFTCSHLQQLQTVRLPSHLLSLYWQSNVIAFLGSNKLLQVWWLCCCCWAMALFAFPAPYGKNQIQRHACASGCIGELLLQYIQLHARFPSWHLITQHLQVDCCNGVQWRQP